MKGFNIYHGDSLTVHQQTEEKRRPDLNRFTVRPSLRKVKTLCGGPAFDQLRNHLKTTGFVYHSKHSFLDKKYDVSLIKN
jgi:hypothetical protein